MVIKLKKEILEAIDQLRGRKARPDVERICNHVHRRYNIEPHETLADLERLVDDEQVMRVEYKGSTSYRNVAKWPKFKIYKNKPRAQNSANPERISEIIHSALKKLLVSKQTYKISGVPYDELQKALIQSDDEYRFKEKNQFYTILALEMNSGGIVMLENGHYTFENKQSDENNDKVESENLSATPKKLMNPWTIDIKEENEEEIGMESPPLSPTTQRMYEVLKICKMLHDAAGKKSPNKRKKDDHNQKNRNNGVAASAAPSEPEGASLAPDKSATPAMRVGSRRKRARQVFDPSDNNLPRNRMNAKRGRPITGNAKQLQQHALQHQLLRLHHQQNIKTVPTTTTTTTTTNKTTTVSPNTSPNKPTVTAETNKTNTPRSNITPVKNEPNKDITETADNIIATTPTSNTKKVSNKDKVTPSKPIKSPKPTPPVAAVIKTPPKSLSPSPSPEVRTPNSTTPDISDDAGCCMVCKDDISNKSFRLVTCQTCNHRVHPLCLKNLDDPSYQPAMKHALKWRCMQCRLCTICNVGSEDKDYLVVCHICDDAFHASCHAPALLKRPTSRWLCYACTVKKALAVGQSMVTYGDKTTAQSIPVMHVPTVNGDKADESSTAESWDIEEMGEVIDWSSEDVFAYFSTHGFLDEAVIMKNQDVDGKSLLLMKRMDVLRGLNLKLGPALKIYNNHVLRMQQAHFNDQN